MSVVFDGEVFLVCFVDMCCLFVWFVVLMFV